MKKNKLTYILLPIVVGIWGTIIYKIVAPKTAVTDTNSNSGIVLNTNVISFEKYEIENQYPDPFLKNVFYPVKMEEKEDFKVIKPIAPKIIKEEPKIIQKPFPMVNYSGIIKNNNSAIKIALLSIEGNDRIMQEGQTFKDLKLVKIYRDSIRVEFEKKQKTFLK